ncbi:MAG: calcium-binding protein [Planctomycetota bacterium]
MSKTGFTRFVVHEYDISGLTAADIELAQVGGVLELSGPASSVPADYEFTLYTANGLTDVADVDGSVGSIGTVTTDRLGRIRFGFDITTILKDRLNAGDTYIGLRIEGTSSTYPTAVVPATFPGSLRTGVDLYIHEVGTANDRPDPVAPGGPITVVNNAGTVEVTGTSANDIILVRKIGTPPLLRVSAAGSVYDFPVTAVDRIRVDLYDGNDFYNDVSKSFIPLEIHAGGGNDVIFSGDGDDIIYGGNGNDLIRGANGDDRLYGGDGVDTLEGGLGDDSLFGGFMTDTLTGGTGDDRFLVRVQSGDNITDFGSVQDTEVHFIGTDNATLQFVSGPPAVFDYGFWEDFAIERIDEGFQVMSQLTEDQSLMAPPVFDINDKIEYIPVLAEKRGPVLSGPADLGANAQLGKALIAFNAQLYGTLNSYDHFTREFAMYATIHEVGHTHDFANTLGWDLERGWVSNPTSTTGLTQYFGTSSSSWIDPTVTAVSDFVSSYADSNAPEDFAETFYSYVIEEGNPPGTFIDLSGPPVNQIPDLQAFMDEFIDFYNAFPYEVTVWYQNFLGIADGTLAKNGVPWPGGDWSVDESFILIPSPSYGVQNYEFELGETADTASQVSYGLWNSEDIDVSEYTGVVDVTLDVKSVGSLDASGPWADWFVAQVIVDGAPGAAAFKLGNLTVNNVYEPILLTVPPGADTISIQLSWQANAGEKYVVDNIEVRGTLPPPPIAN